MRKIKLITLILTLTMLLSAFGACTPEPQEGETTQGTTESPTEAPTEEPTEAPTEEPTDTPTEEPTTEEPTDAPTEEPTTEEPTEAPTEEPITEEPTTEQTEEPTTEEPTDAPTEEPTTEEPTDAPTEEPTTEEPTEAPTEEPTTEEPTEAPTEEPTEAPPTISEKIEYVTDATSEFITEYKYIYTHKQDGKVAEIAVSKNVTSFYSAVRLVNTSKEVEASDSVVYKGGEYAENSFTPLYEGQALSPDRFMVIKLRGEGVDKFAMSFNRSGAAYELLGGLQDGKWVILVYDLEAEMYGEHCSSTTPISSFEVTHTAGRIDIAYVAFCESFRILAQLCGDAEVMLMTEAGEDGNVSQPANLQSRIDDTGILTEERVENADGSVTYFYRNENGDIIHSKKVPAGVKTYFSPDTENGFLDMEREGIFLDTDGLFTYQRYNVTQKNKSALTFTTGNGSIKLARYLVLKFRVIGTWSTTWFLGQVSGKISEVDTDNEGNGDIRDSNDIINIKQNGNDAEGAWQTVIIDLEWDGVELAELGDTLSFSIREFEIGTKFDLAYAALCESLSDVSYICEDTYASFYGENPYWQKHMTLLNSAFKVNSLQGAYLTESTDEKGAYTIYTYQYYDGRVITKKVPNTVKEYMTGLSFYGMDSLGLFTEEYANGSYFTYERFVNVRPSNGAIQFASEDNKLRGGKYLVIKWRVVGEWNTGWFNLSINEESKKIGPMGNGLGAWRVFVFELGENCPEELYKLGFSYDRSYPTVSFDIAYATICDTWKDIDTIVSEGKVFLNGTSQIYVNDKVMQEQFTTIK